MSTSKTLKENETLPVDFKQSVKTIFQCQVKHIGIELSFELLRQCDQHSYINICGNRCMLHNKHRQGQSIHLSFVLLTCITVFSNLTHVWSTVK